MHDATATVFHPRNAHHSPRSAPFAFLALRAHSSWSYTRFLLPRRSPTQSLGICRRL